MDFPPVSTLIDATFEKMDVSRSSKELASTQQSPLAAVNAPGPGHEAEKQVMTAVATSGTKQVGTHLDTVA